MHERGPGWGGGGGSDVACKIEEMAMLHVSVAKKVICPLSILRTVNVACHYDIRPPVVLLTPHVECRI